MVIADGIALRGDGRMRRDESGIAIGFDPDTETAIRATAGFTGDLLTLGNGASIRGLVVQDIGAGPAGTTRIGNVVAIKSRGPDDVVAAAIVECEILNPNVMGFSDEGPHGYSLLVVTLDPGLGQAPPPHAGASLVVQIRRTVIRAVERGGGVFAINFAPHTKTELSLRHNRIEARLAATAGVNRPELVTSAVTAVESTHNIYSIASRQPSTYAWSLIAASGSPHHNPRGPTGATSNTLRMRSQDDRIEGASSGILAVTARRVLRDARPLDENVLDLDLNRLRIASGADAADVTFYSTLSAAEWVEGTTFDVGDGNRLRVRMNDVHGSGPRNNLYAIHAGPKAAIVDKGNQITIGGDAAAFARANPGIVPTPPAELFTPQESADWPADR
ncbi:MAG: hypothetical protein HC809_15965 [Gammaproteobacteria bacterium]|nr:hypothetical protein [Gammaproteobacteria bacterium]